MENNQNSPVIILKKDGPLKITGAFTITDEKNVLLDTGPEAYLCRCGNSGNKPFCDGSHKVSKHDPDAESGLCK